MQWSLSAFLRIQNIKSVFTPEKSFDSRVWSGPLFFLSGAVRVQTVLSVSEPDYLRLVLEKAVRVYYIHILCTCSSIKAAK